jgi:hypothetical protein
MDPKTAQETRIRPKLIELFGESMTNLIFVEAKLAVMKAAADEKTGYRIFVEAVCNHKDVVNMLGASAVEKLKSEWLGLV